MTNVVIRVPNRVSEKEQQSWRRRSGPGTLIRSPYLKKKRAAGSEGKSGVFAKRTGRQQTPLNALILRDIKVLKGSGDGERGQPNRMVEVQRA